MKNYVTPNLDNLFEILKKDIFSTLRTLTIGRVLTFDPKNRTIDAEILITPTSIQINQEVILGGELEYPKLFEVPVLDCEYFSPPIHEGDYCLLIFAERNIDNWLVKDNTDKEPRNDRMHSIADAFAWFGIGNYIKSTFIAPEGYEPPHDLPEICDCPIPKYGYEPDYARLRYGTGEIDMTDGWMNPVNAGVTICARDYSNIAMYAEGSDGNSGAGNIMMYPTNSVHINNSLCNVTVHGDSDIVFDPNNEASGSEPPLDQNGGGKISIFNDKLSKIIGDDPDKPDNWWAGKKVPISDIYRIFAQCKALLDSTYDEFIEVYKLIASLHSTTPQEPTKLTLEGIMDFKARYSALFAPADPEEGE